MELKKGMWVITNDRMKIGQIKDFCTCEMCEKRGFYEPIIDSNSHMYITDYDKSQGFHGYKFYDNLIDLIEVGDYVNGYKIDYTNLKCETPFLRSNQPYRVDNTLYSELIKKGKDYNQPLHFYNDDIKSILTKEQFNSMKYVVERND